MHTIIHMYINYMYMCYIMCVCVCVCVCVCIYLCMYMCVCVCKFTTPLSTFPLSVRARGCWQGCAAPGTVMHSPPRRTCAARKRGLLQ